MKRLFLILVLGQFLGTVELRADEIKLTSGEVIKDCKVLKKDKVWRVELLDGNLRNIKAEEVAEHVEKPTLGDEFDTKLAALGKKDTDGLLALGKWGMENGITKRAIKALNSVIKSDGENVEAHTLLGHEKCDDGQWRYGSALEKYKADKRGKELAAIGWVQVNKEWVDPYTARCLKAGLVKHSDGKWYTKDEIKGLEKGKFWFEGAWYEAKDKEHLDKGERQYKGAWKSIKDLDQIHGEKGNPWEIETEHFVVRSGLRYDTLKKIMTNVEEAWPVLIELCGDQPLMAEKKDKILINLEKTIEDYRSVHGSYGGDDRTARYSNAYGAYFSDGANAIHGYYFSLDYTPGWIQHAVAHAVLYRLSKSRPADGPAYHMIGSYLEEHFHGKYLPWDPIQFAMFNGEWKPTTIDAILKAFDITNNSDATARNAMFGRMGLVFHFIRSQMPEFTLRWMRGYLQGQWTEKELLAELDKTLGEKKDEEFRKFVDVYKSKWVRPAL